MNRTTETDTQPPRPKPLLVMAENIPAELKQLNQWVTWKYEFRDKWTKPPYQVNGADYAKSSDPTTWGTFHNAVKTYEGCQVDGIGIVLTADTGIVGVDFDHCYNPQTKSFEPWATKIIDHFNSYTEASPSGTGVRIFLKGKLPAGGRKKGNIEIYSTGRYLTVTGRVLRNKCSRAIEPRQAEIDAFLLEHFPPEPKPNPSRNGNGAWHPSDQDLLDKAFAAKNGDKLKRLFDGDTSEHSGDDSAADLALCSRLAFWTQDSAQIDRIFRRSGLMREKWDEKHGPTTYGERTINRALAGTTERYEPRQQRQSHAKQPELWPEFLSAEQILNEPDDPTDCLWAECLPTAGSSILVAPPKIGKTTFAVNLTLAVARGIPFLGRATQQCAVAYAYLDGPKREIKQAFKKMGLKQSDPVFIHAGAAPRDYVAWIIAQIERRNAKFIIIDTFQKFFRIENINDYSEVINKSAPMLDAAAAKNVHLLFLHHAGKGDKGDLDSAIGSTAIRGQVQSYLHLKKLPDSERRIFRSDQRHGEGNFPEVAIGFDRQGWLEIKGTREDAEIQDAKPKVRELLEAEDGDLTEKQIRAAIPIRGIIVSKALREMFHDDEVERSGDGKRGKPFRYSLTLCLKDSPYSSPILENTDPGTRIQNSEKSLANKDGIQVPENRDTNGTQIFKSQIPGHESEPADEWEFMKR